MVLLLQQRQYCIVYHVVFILVVIHKAYFVLNEYSSRRYYRILENPVFPMRKFLIGLGSWSLMYAQNDHDV